MTRTMMQICLLFPLIVHERLQEKNRQFQLDSYSIFLRVWYELVIMIFTLRNVSQGPLENSPMFLGFYFNISYFNVRSNEFTKAVFNTPVAYSITFWLCMISSFIITAYRYASPHLLHHTRLVLPRSTAL